MEGESIMSDFHQEQAITRYTDLMRLIHVGAYDERDHEGNYGEDGIEQAADRLEYRAAQHGLQFIWHSEGGYYTLEPMTDEERAAFLLATQSDQEAH
jgi:hypothetical protein